AAGTSGNGSVGNGGGSVASTVTYDAATGATDALGHHGQMQLDGHMTYTGSSADGTTDFYTVYGHRPAGTASSGQAVLSAGTGYTLPSQRFDYYGISSGGNQALVDLMLPPVSTAHSVYNTATAIAAGDYKGAAWAVAPLAAGVVGGVAASYVSKVAGKIIGSETIRQTIQKVAGTLQTEEEVPAGPSGLCFVSGTPVLTPDGWRSIETLRPGDSVISRDETRRMTVVEHVVRLFHNHGRRIVDVALEDAGRHEVLGATPGHPFYVEGHGWTDAGKLHAGDRVESGTGGTLRVRSLTARAGVSDTYNFEVEQTHTYFVGKLRAWVHNACSEGGSATNVSRNATKGATDKTIIVDSKGNALVGGWSATKKLTAPENASAHWTKHSSEFPE
ncbi:HINT domain-containing protein, partial [Acetobacter sp. AN02]|uniref:polymorphic toxin-type HINT domain-containing protein n=1 Tax=Acetobacter sp. AN02 TaxID=2894186 RepID=UPI00243418D4